MRILTALALTLAAASAACAAAPGPNRMEAETAELRSECEALGGVYLPSPRTFTGLPAVDNYCEIREVTRAGR